LTAILPILVFGSAPENFGSCTSTWPYLSVDVDRVGLLTPDVDFSAQYEVCQVCRYTAKWIVGIHHSPVVQWRAVVIVGVVYLRHFRRKVKPLAMATVKVLTVMYQLEVLIVQGRDRLTQ
jgi:hypothetical protein